MKTILVTAGPVYGRLDGNKLLTNRSRGLWARKLAKELADRGHEVTLLLADIDELPVEPSLESAVTVVRHFGYQSYNDLCLEKAPYMDVAVMAAAVVNWIPKNPFKGKMPTDCKEMNIPFILAPRVIDKIKVINPKCQVIGCKLTVGAEVSQTLELAYQTLEHSHACAVVANDLITLKTKRIIHPDRAVCTFRFPNDGDAFNQHLIDLIGDEHFRTVQLYGEATVPHPVPYEPFDRIVEKYRARFRPQGAGARVFGSLAVRLPNGHFLVSPREKGEAFTSRDAVEVLNVDFGEGIVYTQSGKATLNAPLLVRMLRAHPMASAVLHLHEELKFVPPRYYAPAGTVRDTMRAVTSPLIAIEGHGFVGVLDDNDNLYNV